MDFDFKRFDRYRRLSVFGLVFWQGRCDLFGWVALPLDVEEALEWGYQEDAKQD